MFSVAPIVSIPVTVYLERKLRDKIRHAKLMCHGFEDTRECKLAWDQVDGIQTAIHKRKEKDRALALDKSELLDMKSSLSDPQCEFDERACREYDV
jgi:hypothetical protein